MNRSQRRKNARKNKVPFSPNYNGGSEMTYEQYYGVGYERFNNKYVTIKEVE